jgi:hypothetical protein
LAAARLKEPVIANSIRCASFLVSMRIRNR